MTKDLRFPAVHELGISIVIAYYNRKSQLLFTLESFKKSEYFNFEVIIVDDNSEEDQRVNSYLEISEYDFKIKVITIEEHEKTWINPSVAYNIAVTHATKDIVILQNAEVCHVGDVISYVAKHLKPNDWLTFNCYGLGEHSTNEVYRSNQLGYQTIVSASQNIGGNSVGQVDSSGWLNHYDKFFVAYHYCGAIYRNDLLGKMEGGFSKDFENLVGGDDDEFVKRLIYKDFKFKIPEFKASLPFVVHLYHEKSKPVADYDKEMTLKTRKVLFDKFESMGFFPQNDIRRVPYIETPLARRILLTD
jgi:glycosyltransferase involved in cell wall biosynthesis